MSNAQQLALLEAPRPTPQWTPDPDGEHGEVFTRRWIVDLMLDLIGYEPGTDLAETVVVEPSCGGGAFVLPIVERLAESCRRHNKPLRLTGGAIRAFDLLEHNVEVTRKAVVERLLELGETLNVAERLAGTWVTTGDFLLTEHPERSAGFVVGNPPYIRLEDVPNEISDAYRSECPTMRGRADIYVGFYEKGLAQLKPEGKLAFICADRWMHNQYGAKLRKLISEQYAVDLVVSMHEVDAFESDVSAYPAITILRNGEQQESKMVQAHSSFDREAGRTILKWMQEPHSTIAAAESFDAGEVSGWFAGPALWPAGSPNDLELIADLESRFPPLEDPRTGTRVGIGVASGCDAVYIPADVPDVEDDRLLPLLMSKDIAGGDPDWSGRHLINPWKDGKLVDLIEYPKLGAYYEEYEDQLRARHIAKKRPHAWHRTIDRIDPQLLEQPKLLLPDMKAAAHPVLDTGKYYPHHNLYFVVSDVWDLEVLGGILLSDIANLFVGVYCVKMRGGTYRFQAQYLRKIRVPDPARVADATRLELRAAFRERDSARATRAALVAYDLPAKTFPTAERQSVPVK